MKRRTVLILHGWPQQEGADSIYVNYFKQRGYVVVSPYLFDNAFTFTVSSLLSNIEHILAGRKPDVVIGISLGGLITPVILKKYPHAKGVFIASNPTLRIEASRLAILIRIARHTNVLRVFGMLRYVPNNVLYWLYQRITPFTGMENERQVYREDMKRNILCIRRIPIHKEAEIVRFVAVTDNTELLKTIHNACVVFSGMNDVLMPVKKGKDLQSLLPNSRNIVSNGGHYNVVTKANLSELDAFL